MSQIKRFIAIFCILLVSSITVCVAEEFDLSYDNNGNLLQGMGEYYEYNSFNQLVKVHKGNQNGRALTEYFYDGTGAKVKKIDFDFEGNSVITYYIDGSSIQVRGQGNIENITYVSDGRSLIASEDSEGKKFFHQDHLGSTRVVTNSEGELLEEFDYLPFGEAVKPTEERYTYTGQENEPNSQLMYYNARYYNPEFMRFTQPDNYFQNVYDPQTLNRYSYARNNPIKNTDPSGHWLHIAIGGLIAAGLDAIWQVANGRSMFDGTMDWGEVAKAGIVGAVATAVWAPAFAVGAGTSVLSNIFAGMVAGVATGTTAMVTSNILNNRPLTENVGNPLNIGISVTVGALIGGLTPTGAYAKVLNNNKITSTNKQPVGLLPDYTLKYNGQAQQTRMGPIESRLTESGETFFRGYNDRKVGRFITDFDIGTLSPSQRADRLAAPFDNELRNIAVVELPAGTRIQSSITAPAFGKQGGLRQYEILDELNEGWFR